MADEGEAETGSSGTEEAGETGDGDASFLSARFNLFRAILASFRSCFCFPMGLCPPGVIIPANPSPCPRTRSAKNSGDDPTKRGDERSRVCLVIKNEAGPEGSGAEEADDAGGKTGEGHAGAVEAGEAHSETDEVASDTPALYDGCL